MGPFLRAYGTTMLWSAISVKNHSLYIKIPILLESLGVGIATIHSGNSITFV